MDAQIGVSGSNILPSPWRVTEANPVRMTTGLDYERCAALHNELVEIGWVGSGKRLEYDANDDQAEVLHRRTWFEYYGEDAERVRSRLSPSLVAFLERALVTDANHSFFYYVNGLASPDYLWLNHQWYTEMESDRYMTLYVANDIASKLDGLVFDQEEHDAIIQMSIFDSFITQNGRQYWHPLEVVLSAWLDMVTVGKAEAVDSTTHSTNSKFDPWVIRPYSQQQLEDTLQAYHGLLDAIESRIPSSDRPSNTSAPPLLSDPVLDAAHITSSFARQFMGKARQPSFRYIAPGLEISSASWFSEQPFSATEPDPPPWDPSAPQTVQFPILLFRASSSTFHASPSPYGASDLTGSHLPFPWPWSQVASYPAGLYLTDSDIESVCFEDGIRLVLPFGIGLAGYARTADGAKFGENKEEKGTFSRGKDTHGDLYQLGYVPFIESHDVRLEQVLKSWLKHIESGQWEVGVDGVQGDIEKWREADTEDGWAGYVVPMSW